MDEAWRKIKQEGQQKEYEEEKMADGGNHGSSTADSRLWPS